MFPAFIFLTKYLFYCNMRMIFKLAEVFGMKSDYQTKQKKAIIDFLQEADGHLTAAEIVSGLREKGVNIGTATVYRQLEKLEDSGLVRKYITGNCACYQFSKEDCENHFHLKCTSCGELFHIDCDFLLNLAPHIAEHHNFKVDNCRTVMYGTCEKCL